MQANLPLLSEGPAWSIRCARVGSSGSVLYGMILVKWIGRPIFARVENLRPS